MNDLIFCAEIGSNWQGDLDICKYLYDKAKESGANFVKMQFYPCDELYDKSWKFYKMAKKCELSYDTARILKEYADSIDIGWFCSVHTREDIDFLVDIKAPFIKIKQSQSLNMDLINYALNTKIKTIISHPDRLDLHHTKAYHLITTPDYPSKFERIPFKELKNLQINGFSDHTQGIQASLCAAMYENIRIFEFHFCSNLSKFQIDETKTPDFCVSKYPNTVKELIKNIKHIKGE